MKSGIFPNRHFLECSCWSPDHLLVFDINDYSTKDDMENTLPNIVVDVYFTHTWKAPLFTRIRLALSYIFIRKNYSIGDKIILNEKNIDQLQELVDVLKNRREQLLNK